MNKVRIALLSLVSCCWLTTTHGLLFDVLRNKTQAQAKEKMPPRDAVAVAKYRKLKKSLTPASVAIASARYELAGIVSGLVPVGVGAFGAHQLIKGNGKAGVGLLGGAALLAVGRAMLLRKLLIADGMSYQKKLEEFMREWPENKESVPEAMWLVFERFKDALATGSHAISGEEIGAILDTMDALTSVQKMKQAGEFSEARKWSYIQDALAINKPIALPHQHMAKLVAQMYLMAILGIPLAGLVVARVGPLRRYATGLESPAASLFGLTNGEQVAQRLNDAPLIAQEWPSKLLEPIRKAVTRRSARVKERQGMTALVAVGAAWASIVTVGLVYTLIKHGVVKREARNAQLYQLDSFIGSWPLLKSYVPDELHAYFEELYSTKFDLVRHVLRISNDERQEVVQKVAKKATEAKNRLAAAAKKEHPKNTRKKRG